MNRSTRIGAAVAIAAALVVLVFGVMRCGRAPSEQRARTPDVKISRPAPTSAPSRVTPARRGRPAPPLERLALRGIVVDREGAPIAGATVALASPVRSVRSGDDGRFAFTELLPGRYIVEARQGSRIGGPIGVELTPGTRDVTVRLYQGMQLEVEVVAADTGRPVANAEVEVALISMHFGAGRQRALTGTDGVARLEGLTHIGHQLRVSAAGFADERGGPWPDMPEHAPGIRRMRVALHRAAVEIAGRLVDERGGPIEGGEIEAVTYQLGDRARDDARTARTYGLADAHAALRSGLGTRTDAQGRFRFGLEAGTWVLIANATSFHVTVSEPIFVEAGKGSRRELTLVMTTGRTVRGVVVDSNDLEVGAAHVEARWLEGTRVLTSTVADNGGGFELRGLPAAPIELIARTGDARSRPFGVDLAQGDIDGAVLVLDQSAAIDGRVVDERGAGVPDAVVTYFEERHRTNTGLYPDVTVADHEGRFRLTGVAPGISYFLSAARPQDGSFAQHAAGITARAGENVTITIPAGGAIVGRIVGAADPRQLTVREQQSLTGARPTADGRFRLDRLPALRYQLRISGPGIADTYVHDVEVAGGRDTDIGDVVVKPGRRVAGIVVDAAGRPVDQAKVRIEVDDRYAVVTRTIGHRFSVTVLSGVPLRISASHSQAGRSAVLAIGAAGATSALRLAMQPGGTIRGIAKEHGHAIADAPVMVWPAGPRPSEPSAMTITDDAGAFELPGIPAGRWLVELSVPAFAKDNRVIQRGVEMVVGSTVEVEFDASTAPTGTIVQPSPEVPELPVYGEEPDLDHH